MKTTTLCICILIAFFIISPVQAITAKSLDILIQDNKDAVITFDYELGFIENAAVFANVADPGAELKSALESNTGKQVDVIQVTDNRFKATVHNFATYQSVSENEIRMGTHELSFSRAETILNQYWFAPLITIDFSPEVTSIVYPDGYTEKYLNFITIPATSHSMKV